jgi:hypothetical protein
MGPQFHETGYGRKFFEVQLPKLTRAIERVADGIEKQNKFIEDGVSLGVCELESEVIVETPIGNLIAIDSDNPDYPGIWVVFIDKNGDEHDVALVQYDKERGLRSYAYQRDKDDYSTVTRWDQEV